ncbi:MAG TPA: alcohol dehydrogenase catalytic domain-containing protein, partial [Burkholderiales bacterium]|nr:alcohol dehydrogenase catalytic domain-containing protein [Burkholderiales bacterium]
MLSFVAHRGGLEPRQKPLPHLEPGWALLRVRLAGICNTDLEILRGYSHFRGTPGHEFVGEVVDARGRRRQADRAGSVGRRVVGEINITCASRGRAPCRFCRRGLPRHCLSRGVLGIVGQDGAFAEYLALPLANLHAVPAGVTDAQAVFTEPLAAACEILEQVRIRDHREAAVLGDGKLAQLIARVLRAAGLRVALFGKHRTKLALARSAGMRTVRVVSGQRKGRAGARQYSLVVEATGSPSGFPRACELTAPRGTLVLKSTFHGTARVETWPIVVDELTLVGSRCGP